MSIQALFALVFSFLIPDHLQFCQLFSRLSPSAQPARGLPNSTCSRRSLTERVGLTVGLPAYKQL